MTHPEQDRPEEEDGGTFKLKPSGAAQPEPAEQTPEHTMKLRKVGGASPDGGGAPPPPPSSPLGNPTGPANPPAAFNETTVMPPSGGSQTGFRPSTQAPPPGAPLGQPPQQPPPGAPQQPYGQQQPPPGQLPPQQPPPGYQPRPQQGGFDTAPKALHRVSMLAMISGAAGIVWALMAFFTGELGLLINGIIYLLTSGVVLAISFALPRGVLKSKRWRQYAVGVFGAHGLVGLSWMVSAMTSATPTWFVIVGWLLMVAIIGAVGYGIFLILKDPEIRSWFEGAPAGIHQTAGGAVPPPTAPGQQPGQTPGGYPPPPPGYQGQQPPQPPYGR